jgi:hypothetical protein
MPGRSPLEDAFLRLASAMERVEGTIEERLEDRRQSVGVETELQRLGTDRSRLAQSLDAAEARAARLEDANREVSRRLVSAMESIRSVLERGDHA